MKQNGHVVHKIEKHAIAKKYNIQIGDQILAINGEPIEDVFDYQYLVQDEEIKVLIKKCNGNLEEHVIIKEYNDDLGIVFESSLMDDYRSCHNKCIFCFIDQMPKGMRETLYFKDDDSRLSFLQGNYITLTNMSEKDIERIIKYKLSPINISFQATNPEVRCKMLNNRFAGDVFEKVKRFANAGITMNGQIVLCKGVNDGNELERSISDLVTLLPHLESVSVVPVGLTKFREGLFPLECFTKSDALEVLSNIEKWQKICWEQYGSHFIHASDEWYILAQKPLPKEETYDGYVQLENGVGMLRLLLDEFEEAFDLLKSNKRSIRKLSKTKKKITIATGMLVHGYIKKLASQIQLLCPNSSIEVIGIVNEFFGEKITVSGLLTGQDIVKQLNEREIGHKLLLPQNVLRSGETVFLDDMSVADMESALQVKVDIVKSSGYDFVQAIVNALL